MPTYEIRLYYSYCDRYEVRAADPWEAEALVDTFMSVRPDHWVPDPDVAPVVELVEENAFVDYANGLAEDLDTGDITEL